jgi:hypothetical protein
MSFSNCFPDAESLERGSKDRENHLMLGLLRTPSCNFSGISEDRVAIDDNEDMVNGMMRQIAHNSNASDKRKTQRQKDTN